MSLSTAMRFVDRWMDSVPGKIVRWVGIFWLIFTQRWGLILAALVVGVVLGFGAVAWERKRAIDDALDQWEMDGSRKGDEDEHV